MTDWTKAKTNHNSERFLCICPTDELVDGVWGSKSYRDIAKITFPQFESPTTTTDFMRGGLECNCTCTPKLIPRNVILIRPTRPEYSHLIYEAMAKAWKGGYFQSIAHGSCQQFLRLQYIRKELKPILDKISISCVDNADPSILQEGDVLLTRIGEKRSVGRPYLILESLQQKKEVEESSE